MSAVSKFFRRGEVNALLFAFVWASAVVVSAFSTPMYGGEGSTFTFVEVNGTYGTLVAAMPLILSLATTLALRLRGRRRAGPMSWTLTIVCAAFSLVTITSIGLFALPVVGCLIYACAVHGRPKGQPTEFEFSFPRISRNPSRSRHEP